MSVVDRLTSFYYSLEDKYYNVLDSLAQKGLPVYPVNDFFEDKGVPPFAVLLAVLLLAGLSVAALTLSPEVTSDVSVRVVDKFNNAPISGVQVSAVSPTGETLATSVTDSSGRASLSAIPGREVDLRFSKPGYQTQLRDGFVLSNIQNDLTVSFESTGVGEGETGDVLITLLDSQTRASVSSKEIAFEVCEEDSRSTCKQFLASDYSRTEEGKYALSGVKLGVPLLITAKAASYEDAGATVNLASTVNEVTIEMRSNPFNNGPKDFQVNVVVTSETGELVQGAQVSLHNVDFGTSTPITTSTTSASGEAVLQFTLNQPTHVLVSVLDPSGAFAQYNSLEDEGVSQTVWSKETITWQSVRLKSGGSNASVLVTDLSGQPLPNSLVRVFNESGTEMATDAAFVTNSEGSVALTGLDGTKDYVFTAYKQGFLPQSTTSTPQQVHLPLTQAENNNSGTLQVRVIGPNSLPLNNALIELTDSTGMPLGYPVFKTGADGLALSETENVIRNVASGQVLVKAFHNELSGSVNATVTPASLTEVEVALGLVGERTLSVAVLSEDGERLEGATIQVVNAVNDAVLFTDTSGQVDSEFTLSSDQEVVVKANAPGHQSFSSARTDLSVDRRVEATLVEVGESSEQGFLSMQGVFLPSGEQVFNVSPGTTYVAKFQVNWPTNLEAGGLFFMLGSELVSDVEEQEYGITALTASGSRNTKFGRTYTPPLGTSEDLDSVSRVSGKSKWVQTQFVLPEGSQEVLVKFNVEEDAAINDTLQLNYRAWGVRADGSFERFPEDSVLGSEQFTDEKHELYAETLTSDFEVLEVRGDCEGNVCIQGFFTDEDGFTYQPNEFTPVAGEDYALTLYLTGKQANQNAKFTVNAKPDTGVLITGYSFASGTTTIGSGTTMGLEALSADLGVLNLSQGSQQQVTVHFTTEKRADFSYLRVIAEGGDSASLQATDSIQPQSGVLAQTQYAFSVGTSRDLFVDYPRTWSLGETQDLQIKLSNGESFVKAERLELTSQEGDPLAESLNKADFKLETLTDGEKAYVLNDFTPASGVIRVLITSPGFKPFTGFIFVGEEVLRVEPLELEIPAGEPLTTALLNVENNVSSVAGDVQITLQPHDATNAFQVTQAEGSLQSIQGYGIQDFELSIQRLNPPLESATQNFTVNVTADYGAFKGFGRGLLTISHLTEAKDCLKVSPSQASVFLGASEASALNQPVLLTLENECSFKLRNVFASSSDLTEGVEPRFIAQGTTDESPILVTEVLEPGKTVEFSVDYATTKAFTTTTPITGDLLFNYTQGVVKTSKKIPITGNVSLANTAITVSMDPVPSLVNVSKNSTYETKITITNNGSFPLTAPIILTEIGDRDNQDLTITQSAFSLNDEGPSLTLQEDLLPGQSFEAILEIDGETLANDLTALRSEEVTSTGFQSTIIIQGGYGAQPYENKRQFKVNITPEGCLTVLQPEEVLLNISSSTPTQTASLNVENNCGQNVTVLKAGFNGVYDKETGAGLPVEGVIQLKVPVTQLNAGETKLVPVTFNAETWIEQWAGQTGKPKHSFDSESLDQFITVAGFLTTDNSAIESEPVELAGFASSGAPLGAHSEGEITNCDDPSEIITGAIPLVSTNVYEASALQDAQNTDCTNAYCDTVTFTAALSDLIDSAIQRAQENIGANASGLSCDQSTCSYEVSETLRNYHLMNDSLNSLAMEAIFSETLEFEPVIEVFDVTGTEDSDFAERLEDVNPSRQKIFILTNSETSSSDPLGCGAYRVSATIKQSALDDGTGTKILRDNYSVVLKLNKSETSECEFNPKTPTNFSLLLPANRFEALGFGPRDALGAVIVQGDSLTNLSNDLEDPSKGEVLKGFDDFQENIGLPRGSEQGFNSLVVDLDEAGILSPTESKFGYILLKGENVHYYTHPRFLANEGTPDQSNKVRAGFLLKQLINGEAKSSFCVKKSVRVPGDQVLYDALVIKDVVETPNIALDSDTIPALIDLSESEWTAELIESIPIESGIQDVTLRLTGVNSGELREKIASGRVVINASYGSRVDGRVSFNEGFTFNSLMSATPNIDLEIALSREGLSSREYLNEKQALYDLMESKSAELAFELEGVESTKATPFTVPIKPKGFNTQDVFDKVLGYNLTEGSALAWTDRDEDVKVYWAYLNDSGALCNFAQPSPPLSPSDRYNVITSCGTLTPANPASVYKEKAVSSGFQTGGVCLASCGATAGAMAATGILAPLAVKDAVVCGAVCGAQGFIAGAYTSEVGDTIKRFVSNEDLIATGVGGAVFAGAGAGTVMASRKAIESRRAGLVSTAATQAGEEAFERLETINSIRFEDEVATELYYLGGDADVIAPLDSSGRTIDLLESARPPYRPSASSFNRITQPDQLHQAALRSEEALKRLVARQEEIDTIIEKLSNGRLSPPLGQDAVFFSRLENALADLATGEEVLTRYNNQIARQGTAIGSLPDRLPVITARLREVRTFRIETLRNLRTLQPNDLRAASKVASAFNRTGGAVAGAENASGTLKNFAKGSVPSLVGLASGMAYYFGYLDAIKGDFDVTTVELLNDDEPILEGLHVITLWQDEDNESTVNIAIKRINKNQVNFLANKKRHFEDEVITAWALLGGPIGQIAFISDYLNEIDYTLTRFPEVRQASESQTTPVRPEPEEQTEENPDDVGEEGENQTEP